MNMKKQHIAGIAILIICIIGAFSLSTITLMKSTSSTSSHINAYSFGDPHPVLSTGVSVYMEGTGNLQDLLQREIIAKLQEKNIPVFLSDSLLHKYDTHIIALSIIEKDDIYTPLYSKGTYVIFFYYASSGKPTYFEQFRSGESPVVSFTTSETGNDKIIIEGTVTLKNTSMGVMSPSGYHNHVAEYVAQIILHELENHLYQ